MAWVSDADVKGLSANEQIVHDESVNDTVSSGPAISPH